MTRPSHIHAHLPLTHLSFHILLAISPRQLHGYAIVQAVEELSAGSLTPRTGTFYSAIHRLQANGLLAAAEPASTDRRQGPSRRYYQLTELGAQVLEAERQRLEALLLKARMMGAEVAG